MENISYLVVLILAELLILFLSAFLSKQKTGQIRVAFTAFLTCLGIWTFCLILQIAYQNSPIDPFEFEKFSAFGAFYAPVAFFFLGKIFSQTKIKFNWRYGLLFVIPTISLILAMTNDYHHLFVIHYSTRVEDLQYGPYFTIHSIYTLALYVIGIWYFFRSSIKNSHLFSGQSFFIILGTAVPLVTNLLGLFGVPMPIYLPPITFTITILCYSLAIFKYQFLRVTPIALQKIVDRISDSYLVLNDDNIIIDFNQTFVNTFLIPASHLRNTDIFEDIAKKNLFDIEPELLKSSIEKVKNTNQTIRFEKKSSKIDRYFVIEINSIISNKAFLGTLILFKDTTQHMKDMQTIRDNQDMLMERERLASLGQLIGGIAHNLKTPIMSISGAAEGLKDLVHEYDSSIGDSEVTPEDHHAIAKDMSEWIAKIKSYTEYMSDVITAVKGQAISLSEEQTVSFDLEELVKRVDILMRHELKHSLTTLNVDIKTNKNTTLHGNIVSLVQVINNMISNSIQAYNGEPNNKIDLTIYQKDNNIIISIRDYADGLPEEVKEKLFKEMITTKGKNGTGLGLFMSYSNIRAHFNGNINFESNPGEGTVFNIILPV